MSPTGHDGGSHHPKAVATSASVFGKFVPTVAGQISYSVPITERWARALKDLKDHDEYQHPTGFKGMWHNLEHTVSGGSETSRYMCMYSSGAWGNVCMRELQNHRTSSTVYLSRAGVSICREHINMSRGCHLHHQYLQNSKALHSIVKSHRSMLLVP